MITPILERALLKGKARFKNWSFGVGQLGCIPVNTGQTAIIVDFTYTNYFTHAHQLAPPPARATQKNMHLLRIESGKTVNDYVLKDDYFIFDPTAIPVVEKPFGKQKYDCYIVNTDDIKIRIAVFTGASIWAVTGTAPLNDANEPPSPLGYGTADVVDNIDFGLGIGTYKPMTSKKNKRIPPAPSGLNMRDELNINFNLTTNPAFDPNYFLDDQIPIINFSVVYIEENLSNLLLSSK